jgi:hypothetical protein
MGLINDMYKQQLLNRNLPEVIDPHRITRWYNVGLSKDGTSIFIADMGIYELGSSVV